MNKFLKNVCIFILGLVIGIIGIVGVIFKNQSLRSKIAKMLADKITGIVNDKPVAEKKSVSDDSWLGDRIIFNSRREAFNTVLQMMTHCDEYGFVTINDYYDICECKTDNLYLKTMYGWTEDMIVEHYDIINNDIGFIISLPEPIRLGRRKRNAR